MMIDWRWLIDNDWLTMIDWQWGVSVAHCYNELLKHFFGTRVMDSSNFCLVYGPGPFWV